MQDVTMSDTQKTPPSMSELATVSTKVGLLSFGGPVAQIALMHEEYVEKKQWLGEKDYLHALSFCMLLPGPEAMQLATYIGWRLRGILGGLIVGCLFVIPGALIMLLIAYTYALYSDVPYVHGVFFGIKATVVVIVFQALLKVSKKSLTSLSSKVIFVCSFFSFLLFSAPFPVVILCALVFGFFSGKPQLLEPTGGEIKRLSPNVTAVSSLTTLCIGAIVWFSPIVLLYWFNQTLLVDLGIFFSKLAVVTFGGAYAVLSYLVQDVVVAHNWLSTEVMMDGLGLAETTPGPLILVNEFVGFIVGFQHAGIMYAVLASLVVLWVTFVPCFLWIFLAGPYIDWLNNQPRLNGALASVSAAVVGAILHLSLWLSMHVLFRELEIVQLGLIQLTLPSLTSWDSTAMVLSVIAGVLLIRLKWPVWKVIVICAAIGLVA